MEGSRKGSTSDLSTGSRGTKVGNALAMPPNALISGVQAQIQDREQLMQEVEAMMNQPSPTTVDVIIIGGGPGGVSIIYFQ